MSFAEIKRKRKAKHETRVQLNLAPSAFDRLATLKRKTEANNYAEVMRSALKLYEHVLSAVEAGGQVQIKDKAGEIKTLEILI